MACNSNRYQYETLRNCSLQLVKLLELENEVVDCRVLRRDWAKLPSTEYALMRGKEVILHCELCSVYGQVFTDTHLPFKGLVKDVLNLDLKTSHNRAVFFATLNAIMHLSGKLPRTVHCRGVDAENCGELMVKYLKTRFGEAKVLHVGYQPGHIKALVSAFKDVYVTDMNPENVGKTKFGIKILPRKLNPKLIKKADVVCITGSTLINGTLFSLIAECEKQNTPFVLYGVSAKSAAKFLGYDTFCPLCSDEI